MLEAKGKAHESSGRDWRGLRTIGGVYQQPCIGNTPRASGAYGKTAHLRYTEPRGRTRRLGVDRYLRSNRRHAVL